MPGGPDGQVSVSAVFIHGLLGWPEVMGPLAQPLSTAGARTGLLELKGARQHWTGLDGETWREWIAQALDAVSDMKRRSDRVFVVGAYGGALLAAIAAAKIPLDGSVFLCPPLTVEAPGAFLRRRGGLMQVLGRFGAGRPRGNGGRGAGNGPTAGAPQGNSGPPVAHRPDGAGLFPDGDPLPMMAALELNLVALQAACEDVLPSVRNPVLVAYPRRGGLSPEGSMDGAYERLKGAAVRELTWLESPEEAYGPTAAERVYRFASRYAPALPLLPVDADTTRLEGAARSLQAQVSAAIQRVVDFGATGPCQVASFLVTEWLLRDGYDAFVVGAAEGGGSTEVSDHYWTEVCLGRQRYIVDFTANGIFDVRPLIRPSEAALKDGYAPGRVLDLRLPSVRRKVVAEIRAFNPGLDQYVRELG